MQKRKRRRSDRAGRPAMRSPGRPPVAGREEQQRFWKAIARGLSSEDAAVLCGVSPPVGGRWFREGGDMPPIRLAHRSARFPARSGRRGARHCPSAPEGVVARIVAGPHDAHRQDPHLPMRYDTGRPRAVIRLRISQPRTTSLPCPAGLRARRPSPMMDL